MSIVLTTLLIRSDTRVRLTFSGALAAGAFNASLYTMTDVTQSSPGPTVKAALAVSSVTNQVELVLATPLTSGDAVCANCTLVPAADSSFFTGNATSYYGPQVDFLPNVEPAQNSSDTLVFGRDLVHNGLDYVEDATGDLAVVEGVPNVKGALFRRVLGYGLPWDQSYGPRLEDYVDGPNASAAPATGLIKRQMLADDRVTACTVSLEEDSTAAGGAFFVIEPLLKTNRRMKPFDVAFSDVLSSGE